MNVANINKMKHWFQVLDTTDRSQSAVMTLSAGGHSSEEMNVHQNSDQVLLVVEGEVEADIAGEKKALSKGDTCIVPAGTPHRFANRSKGISVTFNVYSPPEYSPNEKE
jgi:mannose-6-phosphate isomerase-like protein (cupin superfamily)